MNHPYVGELLLADPTPTGTTFSDGFIYDCHDNTADTTYDCYQSTIPPQIVTTHVDELQTVRHATWASAFTTSEVCPPSVSGPEETLHYLIL